MSVIKNSVRPTDLPELKSNSALPPPLPATRKKGGGCGCFVKGCVVVILLVIGLGIAGFVAIQSGALTVNKLLNLVGMGPAKIEVDNFRDDAIQVNIRQTDAEKDSTPIQRSLVLNAFDVKSYETPSGGKFRVTFTTRGGNNLGECLLTVKSGDEYQFVALPERIAINRVNNPATAGSDFVMQTSALCR